MIALTTNPKLPIESAAAIERILTAAESEGRRVLFEHEVYAVLAQLGLTTPVHGFVRKESQIDTTLLLNFSSEKIVLKAVARGLAHKEKAGGVRVVYKDLEFIKFTVGRMIAEFATTGVALEGVLLVEHVIYSKDLGNETLLGFRESDTFGPVISFSKGGSDAEHFAAHFSPANLILAPIDEKWARALLESTHIQKKFMAQGKTGYVSRIVDAGVVFSDLALAFSNYFDSPSTFSIVEFEVNPFVFAEDGRFVALDGFARFERKATVSAPLDAGDRQSLIPFFNPRGIAVIGVSATDTGKTGNIILENLIQLGRRDVYGVNIKGGRIQTAGRELELHRSVAEIEGDVELAVVTVPAEATLPVINACVDKNVRAAILISGGFSETDRNRDLESAVLTVARENGLRVMGPNCLGIIYSGTETEPGINTFFIPREKFTVSMEKDTNVAILSQSGALGIIEIENLSNAISPKVIVSYGNQLDVDVCDLIAHFQQDPAVDVIGCYIEGFKHAAGRRFFNIAARSRKPMIVYKAGRTEAGRKATESHTASIAGEYAVARAAMKQAGVIVADAMIDHGDFIKTFTLLNGFRVNGPRTAIIANAGYEKTNAADNLGDLAIAEFDATTRDALARVLPPMTVPDPLLDLTPMADDETFERCIDIVLRADNVDALLVSIVPQSALLHTTDAEIEQNPDNIAARILRIVRRHQKPVVISVNVASRAGAVYNRLGQTLEAGGLPTFLTANRAMTCLNAFVRYHLSRRSDTFSEWLK